MRLTRFLVVLSLFGAAAPLATRGTAIGNDEAANPQLPPPRFAHEDPLGPLNLACVTNGAKQATSAATFHSGCPATLLNDGVYAQAWIPTMPHASFQIELAKLADVGRFKFARGGTDRLVKYLKIETSADGQQWQNVFERDDMTSAPGFNPRWVTEVHIEPVKARFVRGTVAQAGIALAEFEVLGPSPAPPPRLPAVVIRDLTGRRTIKLAKPYLNLPIKNRAPHRRLTIQVDGRDIRVLDVELAPANPDFWAFVDVSAYQGQEATILVDCVPEDSRGLDSISQDDQIRDSENLYREQLRPQFHYTPKRGWVNDPNGLVYHDGEWHLFYQHHAVGWVWGGFTHWGHAVSKDLLHWQELPEALLPYVMAKGNCWSGSAFVDAQNTAGFQTGKEPAMVAAFFDTGCGEALAYSNDRGRSWTYWQDNPVVKHKGRDPKVFWYEPGNCWVMIVYDETDGVRNFAIYNSANLKQWTLQSHLPGYFECPELFELPVEGDSKATRWVVFGVDSQYAVGRFDGKTFTPEHEGKHLLHAGYFAASQTFTGAPHGRRIQMGWGKIDMPGMPFNQMMTFPCELTLHNTPDGLRMQGQPVKELTQLHAQAHHQGPAPLVPDKPVLMTPGSRLLDVQATIELGSAKFVGVTIFGRRVTYDVAAQKLDQMPIAPSDGKIHLQLLVDRASLETYVNHGERIVTSPMPADAKSQQVGAFAVGGEARLLNLDVFELSSIWK